VFAAQPLKMSAPAVRLTWVRCLRSIGMTISLRFAQRARQRAAVADLALWLLRRLNAGSIPPLVAFFLWRAKGSPSSTGRRWRALGCQVAGVWPRHSLADRLGISRIVLIPRHIGRTYCGGIRRTSWPQENSWRPQ
jgi:hypothetical protein